VNKQVNKIGICNVFFSNFFSSLGGFYKCNKFEGLSTEDKESKQKAFDKEKSMLEKYIFYFERFNNNQKAEKQAKADQVKMADLIKEIHDKIGLD